MLWNDNEVSHFSILDVKAYNKSGELISDLENIAKRNNVNIYNVKYQNKTANGRRKIKVLKRDLKNELKAGERFCCRNSKLCYRCNNTSY